MLNTPAPLGIKNNKGGHIDSERKREELSKMEKEIQSVVEKLIERDLGNVTVRARELRYSMDFGTTEVALKIGLN